MDFLNLCREIFKESGKLNYIYDQEGTLIENIEKVQDKSILFVKRDPGFFLTESEFNHVIRALDREQRIRQKPKLDPSIENVSDLVKHKSNYQKLIDQELVK